MLTLHLVVMEQIILGAETILQTKEEGIECILVWGVVCDFAYAMSDHEFVALGDTMHRRIATILTTSVEKTVQFPVNPDFDLAVKCHGILDESVIVSRRVPGIIRNDSLGALDTLCLELFRAYVEAEGFYLTNWEKLIQEPVSPGDVYSGITWWEVPRQGNKTMVNPNNADWRVRWLRESYTERRSFLVQIRNTQTSTLCKGGIIRRASV